ncbi:MAG: hypothetical protein JWM76_1590 [Pseudonocardiales bacterium]|nr:hypothetical protein [Pseudonocardiales bacterium]
MDGTNTDLVPFQAGAIVSDIEEQIELHKPLTAGPWAVSKWAKTPYYDARADCVIEPRWRAAFGRLSPTLALEFIQIDRSHPLPVVWDLESELTKGHVGYWSKDPRATAVEIIRGGGKLLMARATTPELMDLKDQVRDPDWLPASLEMCYLSTGAGLLIELIPTSIWGTRLVASFGPEIQSIMPPPPGLAS